MLIGNNNTVTLLATTQQTQTAGNSTANTVGSNTGNIVSNSTANTVGNSIPNTAGNWLQDSKHSCHTTVNAVDSNTTEKDGGNQSRYS
jgi:hypothetical protein